MRVIGERISRRITAHGRMHEMAVGVAWPGPALSASKREEEATRACSSATGKRLRVRGSTSRKEHGAAPALGLGNDMVELEDDYGTGVEARRPVLGSDGVAQRSTSGKVAPAAAAWGRGRQLGGRWRWQLGVNAVDGEPAATGFGNRY
jgi:hypothetical protein